MIRISKKTDYAIFMMGQLARRALDAERGRADDDLLSAQDLAAFTTLNKSVVANLLKDLTRSGLLGSVRGVRGGYRLARPADEISLRQILEALEGPLALVACAEDTDDGVDESTTPVVEAADADCGCSLSPICPTRGPLHILQDRILELVDALRLPELSGLDASTDPFPAKTADTRRTMPSDAAQTSAPQSTS